jgi:hypothetical protein
MKDRRSVPRQKLYREIWVQIDEAPRYRVSNKGRIMNANTGRILQPCPGSFGHQSVVLRADGVSKTHYVHILVATYFCPGYQPGYKVGYRDEDRSNLDAANLYWKPATNSRGL